MRVEQAVWVHRLVAAILEHEDTHASPRDGGVCLEWMLDLVPEEFRARAEVFRTVVAEYRSEPD